MPALFAPGAFGVTKALLVTALGVLVRLIEHHPTLAPLNG
jgi:hypothetical protein